ncbi:hypothetical protein [Prescottella equi]
MARMAFDRNNHLWQEQPSGLWQGPNGQLKATLGELKGDLGPIVMVRTPPQPAPNAGVAAFPTGGFART